MGFNELEYVGIKWMNLNSAQNSATAPYNTLRIPFATDPGILTCTATRPWGGA